MIDFGCSPIYMSPLGMFVSQINTDCMISSMDFLVSKYELRQHKLQILTSPGIPYQLKSVAIKGLLAQQIFVWSTTEPDKLQTLPLMTFLPPWQIVCGCCLMSRCDFF